MTSSENSSALNAPLPSSGAASSPAISPDNGFDMKNLFSPENILKAVYTKIVSRNKNTPGLDFVSSRAFIASLKNEIAVIQRKTANNTFLFTSYHLNLVSKGPDKLPRKICIPTIRDRVVIALISAYLKEAFPKETRRPLANVVVNRVLKQRNSYQRFFKLDIKTFFASIDHELLFRKLRSRIHDETVLSLLLGIVNTKSFDPETRKTDDSRSQDHRGIPEGLSCSGLLADIFLSDVDAKYSGMTDIAFFRYVDDILVFTDKESFDSIKKAVTDDINALSLNINEDKNESGDISETFQYLGYVFNGPEITVRKSSELKHEEALERMFRKYAALLKSPDLSLAEKASLEFEFKNKISMLCAGVKVDEKQLGWLSYYRRINDTRLLHRLDWLVGHFQKRFGTELSDVKELCINKLYNLGLIV
ncbi:MAG: reverse transcriptase domain-containing protein [Succinimonas sp.]|nr:reverse transcriptase domain-containing protein [Succinimonas sp.]